MEKQNALKLSESRQIRSLWDAEEAKWYFSIIDVIEGLTETECPRKYWSNLKAKLIKDGSELSEKIGQLKMQSADGKFYKPDVADTEQLFRLIQSIPSPKAEPFRLLFAKTAHERIDEVDDTEIGFNHLLETYLKKGYSKEWVTQRLKSHEVRKEPTDEWDNRGVKKGQEYAILTDEFTKAWAGLTVKQYVNLKDLKKEYLRDHMTNLEFVLNMLAEATTTEISKKKLPKTFEKAKKSPDKVELLQVLPGMKLKPGQAKKSKLP